MYTNLLLLSLVVSATALDINGTSEVKALKG